MEGVRKRELVARVKVKRAMSDLKLCFSKKYGIIRVVFRQPSTAKIIEGLQDISDTFKVWTWDLIQMGVGFLAEFPFKTSLDRALSFRLLKCKGDSFGLWFKQWTREEEPRVTT